MDSAERAKRFKEARTKYNVNGKESILSVEVNTGISHSMIADLESENRDRPVRYTSVVSLADYYGVNVAWLMGQSDSPTCDESHQVTAMTIGLSDEAVRAIVSLKGDESKLRCLDALLSSYGFGKALMMLSLARELSMRNEQSPELADMIEKANYFGVSHGLRPENGRISNRQLIKMYRNDALAAMAEAFGKIAPEERG